MAKRLVAESPRSMRYIYMGLNIESSNVMLPTTRLLRRLKRSFAPGVVSRVARDRTHYLDPMANLRDRRGPLAAAARMANRLAEQAYRECVSWAYQLRGLTVIYDRHFYFETEHAASAESRFTDRVLRWFIMHCLPRPKFIVFFDSPPAALVERSGGVDAEFLRRKRQMLLTRLRDFDRVVVIAAGRPPEDVYGQVRQAVTSMCQFDCP